MPPGYCPFGGQLDVVINVERGDQILQQLDLLVDDVIVSSQTFGVAAAPADEEADAQVEIQQITLSVATHDYTIDAAAGTATVLYPNGDHTISAQLFVAGASTPIASNTRQETFFNPNQVHVEATLPTIRR